MASYRSVDPKSWSYLRGISILQQIVCENAQQIEQIYVSPGHIFVSLCKGKLLCTFDATPTQKFLKHNEEEKITEELSLFLKDPTKGFFF